MVNLDITSTALEKVIDTAKNFLDKLIMPTIEETGLLLKDQVTLWKFKNQVRMLNKAKSYCEKNNISPKTISLKLLCPLLDYAGIEDEEILHDKWAILLSNMVDSDQNIENHVFPYILSQISSNEFMILEKVFDDKQDRIARITKELVEFRNERPKLEEQFKNIIVELENKIKKCKLEKQVINEIWNLQGEKREYESKLNMLKYKESSMLSSLRTTETIPSDAIKEFELSNLIRLGLVKEIKEFYANSQRLEIPNDRDERYGHTSVDLDIDVDSIIENVLTELGELFIIACKEKTKIATKEE